MATKQLCSIQDCCKPSQTRGWCEAHYARWKRYRDPLAGGPQQGLAIKFFKDVVLNYNGDECLIWPFSTSSGYGSIKVNRKTHHVHRLLCEAVYGSAPLDRPQAAHSCGEKRCVARNHLRWASQIENEFDKRGHGKLRVGEAHTNSKLTEDDVIQIRSLKGAYTMSQIGDLYGISAAWVSQIHRRIAWAWLE